MACISEQHRLSCAVGGIYTVLAIEKFLPILHTGPGCEVNAAGALTIVNGAQTPITYIDTSLPCTDFCEEDIVFGGNERLRKLVDEALKYFKADLAIIVDGCAAEIVGDDIGEVAESFEDADIPTLHASLPGFKGNNLWGHSQILSAIIDQYLQPSSEKIKGLANVFGIVPYYDTFWETTLERLEELLSRLGLTPNIIYGIGKGKAAIDKIPQAEFNLVIGPWLDLDIAKKLENKFGAPYFHYPVLPTGASETSDFIRAIVEYAGLDKANAESYIAAREKRFFHKLQRLSNTLIGGIMYPKRFVINASAGAAVSIARFLIRDAGLIPHRIYIPEDVPEEHQARIEQLIREPVYDTKDIIDYDIKFTDDGGLCESEIKNEDFSLLHVNIFGTTWDELLAKNKGLPYVAISPPSGDYFVVGKTFFGYDGGLEFIRDLQNDSIRKFLGSGAVANVE
ncbi:MAG: nitrogenase molybdenum-iron protein, alpha and beta chain [Clostridiales bacterium]|jgi:nitrogenase molybdenum-iron protein beta chain|nr:nitrogenase molybdenum-iron protein, alpha and beta chain [Clostridiales bacterium]